MPVAGAGGCVAGGAGGATMAGWTYSETSTFGGGGWDGGSAGAGRHVDADVALGTTCRCRPGAGGMEERLRAGGGDRYWRTGCAGVATWNSAGAVAGAGTGSGGLKAWGTFW